MKQHVLEALAAKSVGDLSPVSTARKGRAGCSPWEFAFGAGGGKVWILAVVWLFFTWQWVGDAGSDTSVFVPGAATSQPCSPELEEENLHQTKGCERLCVYRRGGKAEMSSANFPHPSCGCLWKVRWKSSSHQRHKHFVAVCVCN